MREIEKKLFDDELLEYIKNVTDERPTYGYKSLKNAPQEPMTERLKQSLEMFAGAQTHLKSNAGMEISLKWPSHSIAMIERPLAGLYPLEKLVES